jgi:hypothetical protein
MPDMTYVTLTASLKSYMLRNDAPFVDTIPYLIEQGIIRIYNNAKDIGFEKFIAGNLLAGTAVLAKPNDWLETLSFSITAVAGGDTTYLLPRTIQFCTTYWPNVANTSQPKFYCDINTVNQGDNPTVFYQRWSLAPTPDANYNYNILYAGIPLFNDANPVNFLTARYPDLLLYSCLIECCLFLDNEEKRQKYDTMFKEELATVAGMNTNRSSDKITTRDKK